MQAIAERYLYIYPVLKHAVTEKTSHTVAALKTTANIAEKISDILELLLFSRSIVATLAADFSFLPRVTFSPAFFIFAFLRSYALSYSPAFLYLSAFLYSSARRFSFFPAFCPHSV